MADDLTEIFDSLEKILADLSKTLEAAQVLTDDAVAECLRLADLSQKQALMIAALRKELLAIADKAAKVDKPQQV